MRRAQALWMIPLVMLALLATRVPAQEADEGEQPTGNIADELAAVKTAVEEQDFQIAWQHCHAIVKAAEAREAGTLTGPEHFAIGLAHYYLVAESFDKALQAGDLDAEDGQSAQNMRDHIMAPPPDIKVIGHGERVDLDEYIVEGKTTIVDFFSEYCRPCVAIAPTLERLASTRQDIAVVKLDINRPGVQGIDWQSPTARQFNLGSIPFFMIFGPDCQLMAQGDQARALIQQWTGQ